MLKVIYYTPFFLSHIQWYKQAFKTINLAALLSFMHKNTAVIQLNM